MVRVQYSSNNEEGQSFLLIDRPTFYQFHTNYYSKIPPKTIDDSTRKIYRSLIPVRIPELVVLENSFANVSKKCLDFQVLTLLYLPGI